MLAMLEEREKVRRRKERQTRLTLEKLAQDEGKSKKDGDKDEGNKWRLLSIYSKIYFTPYLIQAFAILAFSAFDRLANLNLLPPSGSPFAFPSISLFLRIMQTKKQFRFDQDN